jgi:hypothetical protein
MFKHLLVGLVILLLAVLAGFGLVAWRSEIEPLPLAQARNFDPELVQRGAHLAAMGNCISCHTLRNGASLVAKVEVADRSFAFPEVAVRISSMKVPR